MALIMVSLEEFLKRLTNGEMLWGCILFLGLFFSIAFVLGVVVGWTWKPKWVNLSRDKLDSVMTKTLPSSSNSSLITAPLLRLGSVPRLDSFQSFISRNSDNGRLGSIPRLDSFQSFISRNSDNGEDKEDTLSVELTNSDDCSASQSEKQLAVTDGDVKHLCQLVEEKDGGPAWMQMMDRSTPTMAYQAWRREPEIGPTQYRSRTVYEDVTPELMRDFFWDDEFRSEWDDMLIYSETLEECPTTGITVAHWIRKFPFFCSDREYIIGRRIWESGRSYYCVTKGVPYPSMTSRNKPRRVDLYYSSWYIRAVESESGNGQLTACEVLLFHHEDMGIPREIAKLGIRQGMWGAVKKIDPGLRAYQRVRASGAPLSRCAIMAQLNTKINADYLRSLEANASDISEVETLNPCEKPSGANIPKLLFVGGAVVLACSLDRGLLVKAVIFGVARSFTKIGKRKL